MSPEARTHSSDSNPSRNTHCTVGIHPATQTHLDQLALKLRPLVGCYVPQWSLFQAAVTWWLRGVDLNSAEFVSAIRAEHTRYSRGNGPRPVDDLALVAVGVLVSPELTSSLDDLAGRLSPMAGRQVSRATLILKALASWLPTADCLSQEVVESIRNDLVLSSPPPKESVELHRSLANLPKGMLDRIDALANQAELSLLRTVSRTTIIRAAIIPWITEIEGLDVQAVLQQIRSVAPPTGARLYRCMVAWPKAIDHRLHGLAKQLVPSPYRSAREALAAVLLTAMTPWMKGAERQPSAVFETIRATNVKRGRRATR